MSETVSQWAVAISFRQFLAEKKRTVLLCILTVNRITTATTRTRTVAVDSSSMMMMHCAVS